jgi:acetoacetyl-CoA synthetase
VTERGEVLWTPTRERIESTAMHHFAAGRDAAALQRWSVERPEEFWVAVWEACGLVGERGRRVVERGGGDDASRAFAATRFFPDARLSVVENLLGVGAGVGDPRWRDGGAEALVAVDEAGRRTARSWDELRGRVARLAGALAALGVREGDRVAGWLPNGPEAVEAMLATASLGGVWSSCSPDFGVRGVLDRFGQIAPRVLLAATDYEYGGKGFDCTARLAEIEAGLGSLAATVVVTGPAARVAAGGAGSGAGPRRVDYEALVASGTPTGPRRLAFDHPWYVLYSSGTTGPPKCIAHRAGGVYLQHAKEQVLHCDVRPGDRVAYFTTTGWMMWNWLVSMLGRGATVVLYDGSPMHPDANRLLDLAAREHLTLLGVSAKWVDGARKAGVGAPGGAPGLGALRTVCSTGSPLSPEGFAWVYERVARDVHLASISGGTDLCGCFVGGDPTRPVRAGEIQGPMLGMDVDVLDDAGGSLVARPDDAGELVCRAPFPSMPLGFGGDGGDGADFMPDPARPGPRYLAAYYARQPGVWAHGDFASWTAAGGMVIHGRSDATLNPGGVRIGTAEIYRAVEGHPDVLESLVVGQRVADDVRIVLALRLAAGRTLDDALVADVRARIRTACTPRHVPAVVIAVADLPRTRSNKLVELAVADAINGRPVRNREALANPEAIDAIVAALVGR